MHKAITGAFLALTLAVLPAAPARAADAAANVAAATPAPFVAPDFAVATQAKTARFKLVPLGPALVKIDRDA